MLLFLPYLYKKIKNEKMTHEYSAVTVFSNRFQYLHCFMQKGKIISILLLNEEVIYKSHGNPQSA